MKKSILIAIVSFLAGAAAALAVAWFAIGGVVSEIMGADDGADLRVSLSTNGVSWETPANKESVMMLFDNLPLQIREMCSTEYAIKVAAGESPIHLEYPEGELYFDWEQKCLQICSEGVNMTVEGVDKAFCDELFGIN